MKNLEKQISEWKEQHGGVYSFPVEDKTAYLREPKMNDFKRSFSTLQNDGEVTFGEELMSILWLGGDDEIKTNDDYFLPARRKLTEFFKYDDAVVTELDGNKYQIEIEDKKCIVRIITRNDIKIAEKKNPAGKPFVTQEKLFDLVCVEKDEAFNDKNDASMRFPLYQAIEEIQNKKVAWLKKL